MNINQAFVDDIPALVKLVNSAYRGEQSKKGWTTEADLLSGEKRIDEASMKKMMDDPAAVILKYTDDEDLIAACVYLQQQGELLYLGMLTVSPELQGAGIGKQLLTAAEEWGRSKGCRAVSMTVISVRAELIAWYGRQGYVATGETRPFPNDPVFGIPTRPLEFSVLEKAL